jgi:UDP-N-acetylmuramate--alanine ligase
MSIYFSGIGGIGMSALARFLLSRGEKVMGSDQSDSELLSDLEKEGIKIFRTQKAEHIPSNCTELIYSEAIPEDHPERQEAKKRGIPQLSYFRKLGKISQDFFTICVAGTHGKSTTTAMAGLALEFAGVDPTVIVGTKVFEWGNKNFREGKSDILLLEACEYRESFLFLKTDIIILTNLEPEHLDYYKTSENYFAGFRKFITKLQKQGTLIADFTDETIQEISHKYPGKEIYAHEFLEHVPELSLPGDHYKENASKVLALFTAMNLDTEKAKKSLQSFRGTWRRFEIKGEKDGVPVIDDYAHHPTEIQATLQSLSTSYPDQKKWVIFQPHQYSRTAEFLSEFATSFEGADEILIPNIYRVRDSESDVKKVSSEILVDAISKNIAPHQSVRYTKDFENTVQILHEETQSGDVVLTMGAGPIHEVAEEFLRKENQ